MKKCGYFLPTLRLLNYKLPYTEQEGIYFFKSFDKNWFTNMLYYSVL
jgi:hypothetical protein